MDIASIIKVKQMLWDGSTQKEVAIAFNVDQSTISRVKSGRIGAGIPWPDGSVGKMPERGIKAPSSTSATARFSAYPPELQSRILDAVNRARAAIGAPAIPEVSEDYLSYIASPPADPEREAVLASKAATAEEERAQIILEEFQALVDKARQARENDFLDATLDATADDGQPRQPLEIDGVPISYDALPWEQVKDLGGRLPIIVKADVDDGSLRTAVCIVAKVYEETPSFWSTVAFARLVSEIKKRLESEG